MFKVVSSKFYYPGLGLESAMRIKFGMVYKLRWCLGSILKFNSKRL
jgi:hypothetical protein